MSDDLWLLRAREDAARDLRTAQTMDALETAFHHCQRVGVVKVRMNEGHPLELPLTSAFWYRAGVVQAMSELAASVA